MLVRLCLAAGLACGSAAAQQAVAPGAGPGLDGPEIGDSFIAVVSPLGAVEGPFDAVPQSRTIYFETNRESFTEVGVTTLAVIAAAARDGGAGVVLVTGHTDTEGSPAVNAGLSMRRAMAIRGDLLARGVPASAVTMTALGQDALAVPTPDETPEALNRRVRIDIDEAGALPPREQDRPIRFPLP